ncbi:hypothetical protein [Flavobacterium sp.]|uniref:hypothetical protein n=1 Tax=Flavobacterium sp. TaxID=239 RepID=UPI003751D770
MSKKKSYFIIIFLILSILFCWYIFIKENDYTITFKAKTATGTVFQGIEEWTKMRKNNNEEDYKIIKKKKYEFIKLSLANIIYNWEFSSLNDSITNVKVGITDLNHSFYNRISIPFFDTKFKEEQLKKIVAFKTGLQEHLKNLKVGKVQEGKTEEIFVAYIKLKSVMQEKAQTMIMDDSKITGFLYNKNIKIIGKPYLEVTHWNLETEQLEFNYCFPINKTENLIDTEFVKFKTIPSKKGLIVSYFGNYRTSDRGWFAILDYAKNHNIEIDYKPLEHFMANPFNGGEELSWEAKICIPFKK